MLTGLARCDRETAVEAVSGEATLKQTMLVQVRDVDPEAYYRKVRITAKTVPSRYVDLKAETGGTIASLAARRGTIVAAGDLIASIEVKDRQERLDQALASLERAKFEYDAALRLQERDLRSASQVAMALSSLRGAEQMVRAMELDLQHTRISAPFDGILQERHVEVGDYVGIGDPVARVIDIDPVVVLGEVTEEQIGSLRVGEHGVARLPDGRMIEGYIRYVASEAKPESRTFPVELEVENADGSIRAGVSADVEIETEQVLAVRINKDLLAVLDDGRVGIKVVDEENRVRFIEADKQELGPDNIWITGLTERIRLITRGQGYTRVGDIVSISLEEPGR
jgi:multidrug efflux system membrane fusion protein